MIDWPEGIKQGDSACVLLSGGQDSMTCLHWALAHWDRVEALSFDYGQRHGVELEQGRKIAADVGVERTVLPVTVLSYIASGALTNPDIDVAEDATGTGNQFAADRGLPSTFIPGRNLVLLSVAASWAAPRGHKTLVAGVCEADDAGYPDCRAEFVQHMEYTLQVGLDEPAFTIAAPLLLLDKARTFQLAAQLGVLDRVLELSHTCYEGDRSKRHPWGYGCGECPACKTRAQGWARFAASLTTQA